MVTVSLKGISVVMEKLKNAEKDIVDAAAAALYVEGNIEMTESKRRCPVAPDGGTLQASGQVSEPVTTPSQIQVILSYGGAASAYAIAVHEHLSVHSPPSWIVAEEDGNGVHWHRPGSGPKFLESVLNESEKYMLSRVAASMKNSGVL